MGGRLASGPGRLDLGLTTLGLSAERSKTEQLVVRRDPETLLPSRIPNSVDLA